MLIYAQVQFDVQFVHVIRQFDRKYIKTTIVLMSIVQTSNRIYFYAFNMEQSFVVWCKNSNTTEMIAFSRSE